MQNPELVYKVHLSLCKKAWSRLRPPLPNPEAPPSLEASFLQTFRVKNPFHVHFLNRVGLLRQTLKDGFDCIVLTRRCMLSLLLRKNTFY